MSADAGFIQQPRMRRIVEARPQAGMWAIASAFDEKRKNGANVDLILLARKAEL